MRFPEKGDDYDIADPRILCRMDKVFAKVVRVERKGQGIRVLCLPDSDPRDLADHFLLCQNN